MHPQAKTLAALKKLETFPITTALLSETQCGKRLRPLTKAAAAAVAAATVQVIAVWKDAVRREAEAQPSTELLRSASSICEGKEAAFTAVPVGTKRGRDALEAVPLAALEAVPATKLPVSPAADSARHAAKSLATAKLSVAPAAKLSAAPAAHRPAAPPATPALTPGAPRPSALASTGDKVRDLCRRTFAAALRVAAEEVGPAVAAGASPEALATDMETALLLHFGGVGEPYKAKFRSLSFNLKDAKNPDLRRKVLLGQLQPAALLTLSAEDLASDAQREENARIREKKLFDSAPSAMKQATTDQFQCGKCRQRKTTYYQMQTRSADEPMTTFVTCLNCNNRWKFC